MGALRALGMRVRGIFAGRRAEDELADELESHVQMHTDDNIALGMNPREARRQAILSLGGVEQTKQALRERRGLPWFETLGQDVRYALRGFRRSPVFSLTVIATLTLGIGGTVSVFSVVDRILFRSLPYGDSARLVSVGLTAPIMPQEFMLGGSYYEWRDHQTPFTALTSETGVRPCDLTEERPARLNCASVEASFLPTLGLRPLLGRNFTPEEDQPLAPRVALISWQLWQSHFGGDASVVNRMMNVDGSPARVIGVLPREFEMPTLEPTDVVVPERLDEAEQRRADPGRPMWALARLKPGMTVERARQELKPVFDYSLRLAPGPFRKEVHLQVRTLRDRQMHDLKRVAWILLGVVVSVWLIACANVTGLLLARGATRERELALRAALGASRLRLARAALTESLLYSLVGGVAGFALAEVLLHLFTAWAPAGMPVLGQAQPQSQLDWRIATVTLGLAVVSSLLFGLLPALEHPWQGALAGAVLKLANRGRLRQTLVVGQIAVSVVLLTGGALLFRSFLNLERQRLGVRTEKVVMASLWLGKKAYPAAASQMAFYQALQRNLRYGPGVEALALSDSVPPGPTAHDHVYASLAVEGRPKAVSGTGGLVNWRWVTPEYFRTLGIPMLRGRGFTDEDRESTGRFVVLSRSLADRLFPGEDPVGQRMRLAGGAQSDPVYLVTGVAEDVKNGGLVHPDQPEYYRLRRDQAEDWDSGSAVIVRSQLPAAETESWIRAQVAALDPTVPVKLAALSDTVDRMADEPRFETLLVGIFAATGLLLAVIGLYGVISFLVAQRTQEIGVRMAVGATRGAIVRMVLGAGMRLVVAGTVVGVAAALGLSRVLASLLFGVGPKDAVALSAAVLVLVAVAVLATLLPARSAARVDPMVALRWE